MKVDKVADMKVDMVADMDFSIIFWAFFGDFFVFPSDFFKSLNQEVHTCYQQLRSFVLPRRSAHQPDLQAQ